MSRILLDPEGGAPTPADYTLVTSEIAFWQTALSETPLHLRGTELCRWAEAFYRGRSRKLERYTLPFEVLRDLCPALSVVQAQELTVKLGAQLETLPKPLELPVVAAELFSQEFLTEAPSAEHAAQFLLWRSEAELSQSEKVLLHALTVGHQKRLAGPEAKSYTVEDDADAYEVLKVWLGWEARVETWAAFPLALPQTLKRRLQNDLKSRVVTEPELFNTLESHRADKLLLETAAELTAEVLRHYPERLTQAGFKQLSRHLSAQTRVVLTGLLPVSEPLPVPTGASALLEWFTTAYLPYRTWPHHDETVVTQIVKTFAEHYLQLYTDAVSGSSDQDYLSWNRTRTLTESEGRTVTLLVVLDGLGYVDAEVFRNELERLDTQGRFSVTAMSPAFGPLPSITRCSKPALERGTTPDRADVVTNLGLKLTKDVELSSKLRVAKPGDVVIWSLTEPDSTYHSYKDVDTARQMAQVTLTGIASRLLEHTQLELNAPLEVVITTDHGRLLSSSSRTEPVPQDMNAEGRAATGTSGKTFPETGYLLEGNVVFLDAERFRMAEDAAAVLTSDSFLTKDGKRGTDAFPHGGLYPEEVLVPWLVLARDLTFLPLTSRLLGSGEANRAAELTLTVVNQNSIPLTLESLALDFLPDPVGLTQVAAPLHETQITVSVTLPGIRDAENAWATLSYRLPDGSLQHIEVSVAVSSQEMYAASNALEDLL